MFHSKDMGEIWYKEILTEQTRVLLSEEHINHIKYTKCTKMLIFFGQIMKHRFPLIIGEVEVIFFEQRKTGSIRCA